MSLTLVPFEKARSLVDYACQMLYEVSISYSTKFIEDVKTDNRQANRQTNKTKITCTDHSIRGHQMFLNMLICQNNFFYKFIYLVVSLKF